MWLSTTLNLWYQVQQKHIMNLWFHLKTKSEVMADSFASRDPSHTQIWVPEAIYASNQSNSSSKTMTSPSLNKGPLKLRTFRNSGPQPNIYYINCVCIKEELTFWVPCRFQEKPLLNWELDRVSQMNGQNPLCFNSFSGLKSTWKKKKQKQKTKIYPLDTSKY